MGDIVAAVRRLLTCAVGAAALTLVAGTTAVSPAQAKATVPLAQWEMNEGPDAAQMIDASPNGVHGVPGTDVVTGASDSTGRTFYRFPTFKDPKAVPANPERIVQVDDSRLNPGTRDYALTITFRTTRSFGNMIQKGQSGAAGGYFKVQAPKGIVGCLFRGVDGSKSVNSGVALNDGLWHTVRCERRVDRVLMTIDGTKVRRAYGITGSISNKMPLTIGGKLKCDQIVTTCDYFDGDVDRVVIETS